MINQKEVSLLERRGRLRPLLLDPLSLPTTSNEFTANGWQVRKTKEKEKPVFLDGRQLEED